MKKTVGVLSLIVMLLSQVFSPFVYAVTGEETVIEESVVEVVEEPEVLEKGSSDETKDPENPVEEENIIVNQEQMSGDNLSGTNTEILSGGTIKEETTEENLEGKEDTDVIIENNMVVEAIVKGFGGEVEYNSEEVRGTKEHKNVKVEVYAETGAFEETPTLVIEPLESEKEAEIKKVILDYNEDTEELDEEEIEQVAEEKITEVVAFDIKFLDKEEKEVQPREGMVKVEFNYTENETLQETEEHEIKVYHLDDKDEKGNTIEEIKDMEVDEPEITENKEVEETKEETTELENEEEQILTVVGDKFSIYTIVQQVKEEGLLAENENQLANFVYGEISIEDPNNPGQGITIMDRNLGAIMTGAGSAANPKSYGYHYQWGNNYGFDSSKSESEIMSGNLKVDASLYPNGYSGSTFVAGNANWLQGTIDVIDNLWSGNNVQGPCPEGWHVPLASEWDNLIIFYAGYYNKINGTNLPLSNDGDYKYSSITPIVNGFVNYFVLPYSAFRLYDTVKLTDIGASGRYWSSSSSSVGNEFARNLTISSSSIGVGNSRERAYGLSVRCFKDTYTPGNFHTITFNFNGGSGSTAAINVADGGILEKPSVPVKPGYVFDGWYSGNVKIEFDDENPVITSDLTLTAKYLRTATIVGDDDSRNTFNYGTIQIGDYVLMDRNLGAKEARDGTMWGVTTEADYYGYYYQWGNNWGFSSLTTTIGETEQVAVPEESIPSKYSNTNWNSHQPWSNQSNLWGDDSNTEVARQGPCLDGWHVPSSGEWKSIYEVWNSLPDKSVSESSISKNFAKDLKLPPAGLINSSLSYSSRGSDGRYWSSSQYDSEHGSHLVYYDSSVNPWYDYSSSYGFSVRCFQNSKYTVSFSVGGEIISTEDVVGGTTVMESSIIPETQSGSFLGWYLTGSDTEFDFSTGIVNDTILYARWNCNEGFVESKDWKGCVEKAAVLLPGKEFNAAVKNLAQSISYAAYNLTDTSMTGFMKSYNEPLDAVQTGIISTSDSPVPVIAWFDNGIIYYYSNADVIYMNPDSSYLFTYAEALQNVDFNDFNMSRVESLDHAFDSCNNLRTADLGNFKGNNLVNAEYMFIWCSNLESIDLGNFVGTNLVSAKGMFWYCNNIESIDLGNFVGNNLSDMDSMFRSCPKLKTINLYKFHPNHITSILDTFYNDPKLKTIYVGNDFDISGVSTDKGYAFGSLAVLVGGNGTKYNSTKYNKTYAKIDKQGQVGYFTDPSHFAIRFKTQAGEEIATQRISTGGIAQALTGRYMNYNYYTGADLEHEYDLTTSLYAYTEIYASGTDAYEVKFYSGDEVVYTGYVTGDNNSKLSIPNAPIKEGYDFLGWYEKNGDEYAAEPFDFTGTVIAGDIELYAKWGNPAVGGYSWHDSCFEYESLGVDENGKYSVRLIGYDSESCGLQDLVIPGLVSKNGKDYYVKKIGELLFSHTGLQGTLVIGDGVEEIERWSFGYNDIEKVIFPDSLKTVGYSAFYGNAKLETIDFGQGVESLGYSSFKDCGLKSLSFPSSLKIIGTSLDDQNGVFQNNTGLQTVEFSEGIEVIGGYSFENTKIESISFPNSLTGIGTYAFANNPILNEVILNEGLQYIGSYAFSNEPSLTSFVIPSTVGYLGSNIFGDHNTVTPITYLEINAKNAQLGYGIFGYLPVKKLMYNGSGSIPGNTFNTLNSLNELIIGDDVTSIGSDAFHNSPITGLIIPGNVKSIGNNAFYNSSLKKLEIENGVLSIGDSVFGIDEIESVFIPDSVTSLGSSVFRGGGIIHRLVVGDGVVSMGNCPFGNVEILELGDGITSLGPWNFCSPSNGVLRKIKIGNGVTSITNGTFTNSKNLEEIEIGNGLVQIQQGVFGGTPNLMNLKLGNSLTTIGAGEFSGAQFSGIQLPLTLTTLGNGVFCSDSVKEPGSIVGMISGATAAQIESLEAQDNTECLVLKKDKYTLTYNAGAHSGLVDNQQTLGVVVDYSGTIQLTGNGAKTATSQKGYTFLGWTTELNGTVPLAANTYTITGDVTLYPVFKKDSITKKIKFYKNGNGGYTYNGNDYTEDQEFILCTIQERYNADEDITTCSEEIEFPMGISENTPVTKGWTRNSEGDGIVYTGGEQIEVTSEDSTISYYLQMYAPEKVFKANYEYGSGVEELTITSGSCMIAETINGNVQSGSCEVALPELNVLTGYHTPLWYKKGEDITYPNLTITLTGDEILEAKAIANSYTVVYQPGEGTGEMESQEFEYDKEGILNKNKYSKEGYHFSGWIDLLGKEYRDGETVLNLITEGILELTAQWLQNPPSAGGGRSIAPAKEQEHNVAEEKQDDKQESNQDKQQDEQSKTPENTNTSNQTTTQQSSNTSSDNLYKTVVDPEIQSAYEWAYEHNVTTIPTLADANPDGFVLRGHLAKMVVNYATNVLGREIPEKIPSECRWNDWRKDRESEEIKDYAVKSCALGLMGLDMPKFLPNMEVTRAQFGTIMSRLLWGKKYAGGTPYYRKHLNALKENSIMTQIENPERRVELRQWVWLMLMRSAENK